MRAFRRELARSDALAAVSRELGFSFSRDDPAFPGNTATRYPFELLSRGSRQECANVFSGEIDGMELIGFDLSYVEEADAQGMRRLPADPAESGPRRVTCVIADVGASFAHLAIAPVGALGGAIDGATWAAWGIHTRPIQFESRAFDARFEVHAEDPKFASAVIDPEVMSWLMQHGDGWVWELQREYVLCTRGLVSPSEIAAMVTTLIAFTRQIPRGALSF